jgi:hypothetical protein
MTTGARTPEELDVLLEDASLVGDAETVAGLFVPGGLMAAAEQQARNREQIIGLATALWQGGRVYLAEPQQVLQARDLALALADHAIAVMRRDGDRIWRYAIWVASLDRPARKESR